MEAARHLPGVGAAIGWPDITDDERFATAPKMMENKVELIRLLDEAFATQDLAYWAQKFEEFDVWWAPCQTIAEVARRHGGDVHEHLGQLIAYARSNKVVPPWSK